jgi:hypothetical protein
VEKLDRAATGQEESRYSQTTLEDQKAPHVPCSMPRAPRVQDRRPLPWTASARREALLWRTGHTGPCARRFHPASGTGSSCSRPRARGSIAAIAGCSAA